MLVGNREAVHSRTLVIISPVSCFEFQSFVVQSSMHRGVVDGEEEEAWLGWSAFI